MLNILKDDYLDLRGKLDKSLPLIDSLVESNSESIKRSKATLANNFKKSSMEEPINFKQLIDSILHSLSIAEQYKDVEVLMSVENKKAFYNNVTIVQSIIQNLLQNALRYRKPNQKNTISISIIDTKRGIDVIIKDTGIGINRNLKQQLFKDILPSSNQKDSHGFGLYGVAQYVKKLNGTIAVKSTLQVGSIFTVNLPTLKRG